MYHLPSFTPYPQVGADGGVASPLSITPSKIGCLRLCQHRHLLRYELGYSAPHGAAEDFGTLNHCLIKILHCCWAKEETNLVSEKQVYEWVRPLSYQYARLRFAQGQIRENLIESACQDIVRYVEMERQNLRFVSESESPFRFRFTNVNLLIEGRIDAVLRYPEGDYTLRDFKSRQEQEDAGVVTHETLAVAALAWEKQRNIRVSRIEVYNLKTGQVDARAFDDGFRVQAGAALRLAAQTLRSATRARRPNDDTVCAKCDERPMCRPVSTSAG